MANIFRLKIKLQKQKEKCLKKIKKLEDQRNSLRKYVDKYITPDLNKFTVEDWENLCAGDIEFLRELDGMKDMIENKISKLQAEIDLEQKKLNEINNQLDAYTLEK